MLVHANGPDSSKSRRQVGRVAALVCLGIAVVWSIAGLSSSAYARWQGAPLPQAADTALATSATPSPTPICSGTWQLVQSPNVGGGTNRLYAVTAVSANDLWAVGSGASSVLIEHYNGAQWSIVQAPSVANPSELRGVAAVSADDVWAVGSQASGVVLIVHWNGVQWSVTAGVTSPGVLYGVAALSANDVWAVGYAPNGGSDRAPLTLHWNGTAWSVVPFPDPPEPQAELKAVAGVASNDVWAVGCCNNNNAQGITAHWDGSSWTLVPNPNGEYQMFEAVAALATNDVWASGEAGATWFDLLEHWDGTQWSQVPGVGMYGLTINGLSAVSPNDIWSVGFAYNTTSVFSLHWDGQRWDLVPVEPAADLDGVVAVSSQDVWAVGSGTMSQLHATIVEHYTSNCPNTTPTVQPTTTTTATRTQAASPSATATAPGAASGTPIVTATPTAAASPSPTCSAVWEIIDSPNPCCGSDNTFAAIAAVSANDIWAVGSLYPDLLTEHWDGTQWSVVATPGVNSPAYLQAVAAVSSNDVWAVGGQGENQTLILHWNGVEWSVSPSGTILGDLNGVAAISPNDAWAVGDIHNGIDRLPLTMHWDGTAWSVVPMPTPRGTDSLLHGVTAIASNDVWAVGCCDDTQAVTAHWDGSAWTLVPNIDGSNAILQSVTAVSGNDVWAAGDSWTTFQDYTIHWDGTQWTQVPSLGIAGGNIMSVSAMAANDVWAVGFSYNNTGTFSAHWDGQQWSQVPIATGALYLNGVVALGHQNVWAVGTAFTYPTGYSPLVEHYRSTCPSATPTAQATNTATRTPTGGPSATSTRPVSSNTPTPGGPSSTPTVARPSSTPTECAVQFSDVRTSDWFYPYVQYLYCRGAISGYADGTFRPYSDTARGQLCKIVVLGFGMPINTSGGPHFSDVPTTNPFYAYIETAYNAGLAGGYADGTFRWGSGVTRAQLSKIAVLAARWPVIDPPTPSFADVPAASPFYGYIETAYCHGIVAGYSDGTFRPGNGATRGQISKIVTLGAQGGGAQCNPYVPAP